MIYFNGEKVETIERLEELIAGFSEQQKQFLRNDFNGIPNEAIIDSIPKVVTSRQMHKALALAGKLSTIKAFIASLPEPNKTLVDIEFNQSNEFQRDNALLNQMAPMIGLSSEQVDQMFIFASSL
jgi:hypothetical protein